MPASRISPARRRDRADAQGLGFRLAPARHLQSRGAAADRAEVPGEGPDRSPRRLRGRRSGKVGTPQAPIPDDPRIVTFKSFAEGATAPAEWPSVTADDVALLRSTGGTTGLPKGAMLTHGNLTSAVSIYDVWASRRVRHVATSSSA
ncbi:AMP-binding protein [Bradyrhizobium japonicum]